MSTDKKLFIAEKNGKYGFKNANDKIVIECKFDGAWDFKDGFAKVQKDGKCGFINTKAK